LDWESNYRTTGFLLRAYFIKIFID